MWRCSTAAFQVAMAAQSWMQAAPTPADVCGIPAQLAVEEVAPVPLLRRGRVTLQSLFDFHLGVERYIQAIHGGAFLHHIGFGATP